jgi:hypothetical protein
MFNRMLACSVEAAIPSSIKQSVSSISTIIGNDCFKLMGIFFS